MLNSPLNLNIEDWSRLDQPQESPTYYIMQDIVSTLENISWGINDDGFCDFNSHEYVS